MNEQSSRPPSDENGIQVLYSDNDVIAAIKASGLTFNIFHWQDGLYTAEFLEKVRSLPRFTLDTSTHEVPAELSSLPKDADVILIADGNGSVATAGRAIEDINRAINPPEYLNIFDIRRLFDRYGILPPAVNKPSGPFRIEVSQWLCNEVEAGRLVFHDHAGLKIESGEYLGHFGLYDETTTRQELNAWLERIGHRKRIPDVETQVSTTPTEAQGNANADTEAVSASAGAEIVPEANKTLLKLRQSDPERRLAALRDLGGDVVESDRDKWRIEGIAALEEQERKEGHKRCSQKTIRQDLIDAAKKERDEQREGKSATAQTWCPK